MTYEGQEVERLNERREAKTHQKKDIRNKHNIVNQTTM